jgi:hypothetical protein
MVSLGAVNFFAGAGVIYAFDHSNPAGKAVLMILLTGSAFSWTVMITKILMVRRLQSPIANRSAFSKLAKPFPARPHTTSIKLPVKN